MTTDSFPGRVNFKFIILMYHIIGEPTTKRERISAVRVLEFEKQIRFLHANGYHVTTLGKAVDSVIQGEKLPAKTVVVTFDDGFLDTYTQAYPILAKFGYPAIVFVISSLVGKSNVWMEENCGKQRKICNWDQLKELSLNGFEIGSHTMTHKKLDEIPVEIADEEIFLSKKTIEKKLGITVDFFAYPFGKFNETVKESVIRAGYKGACSTKSGFNNQSQDCYRLRRIDVFGSDRLSDFKNKLAFGTNRPSLKLRVTYYIKRLLQRLKL